MEKIRHDVCFLRERVAKLEAQYVEADKALHLSRESISKNNLSAMATFILSLLAIVISWLKH